MHMPYLAPIDPKIVPYINRNHPLDYRTLLGSSQSEEEQRKQPEQSSPNKNPAPARAAGRWCILRGCFLRLGTHMVTYISRSSSSRRWVYSSLGSLFLSWLGVTGADFFQVLKALIRMMVPAINTNGGIKYTSQFKPRAGGIARTRSPYCSRKKSII